MAFAFSGIAIGRGKHRQLFLCESTTQRYRRDKAHPVSSTIILLFVGFTSDRACTFNSCLLDQPAFSPLHVGVLKAPSFPCLLHCLVPVVSDAYLAMIGNRFKGWHASVIGKCPSLALYWNVRPLMLIVHST